MMEKVAMLAPGRLVAILTEGLRGHHPLFEPEEIRDAFQAPDRPLGPADANEVGQALLTVCRDPASVARGAIEALPPSSRLALIRLYFRLLDRAEQERRLSH
jgi:hypothetical protein